MIGNRGTRSSRLFMTRVSWSRNLTLRIRWRNSAIRLPLSRGSNLPRIVQGYPTGNRRVSPRGIPRGFLKGIPYPNERQRMDILAEVARVSTPIQAVHFADKLSKFVGIPVQTSLDFIRENRGITVTVEEYQKYRNYVPTFTVNTRAESWDVRQDSSGHLPRFDRMMAR